ncbi:MAG: hypothetical protein AVDCRST_MAG53-805 [uncultured Solirubrobacteraceae bacterium]|uniref:L,D-TPase catalytic domain-containing protein n=1 Tax=uncultured Solirubrobacteraceae bacterium TaxID=1162706 RepID=A0A6J4S202_9ACTN|nr:MAG: hypothetical protein AVDCRST_MAG53-805 [uncultured Solirubrobacteraceae bacterium]
MRTKTMIIPAVLLTLTLTAAGGVLAYDSARTEEIAEGITVAGIAVGGMERDAAGAHLERELVAALERPVVVHHDKSTWLLGAREARITTDVDRVITQAVKRSEQGGALGRTWRRVTGGTVDADLRPAVTFSDRAVVRMIDKIRKGVERPAKDAQIRLTATGVDAEAGRRGLEVKASELHKSINSALISPSAERRFVAETRKVAPKVTRAGLVKRNPVVLIVNRSSFQLKVYKRLKLAKTYPIAVGKAGNDTPAGTYDIANKAVNPAWSVPNSDWAGALAGSVIPGGAPNNPLKSRWLGITDGVGIHGTSERGSIGSNASHGCLRMLVEDVEELYPQVPVGAKVLIV